MKRNGKKEAKEEVQEAQEQPEKDSQSVNSYLLVYFGIKPEDIQVRNIVFRGDNRPPNEILKEGFVASGSNLDVIKHVNGVPESYQENSAYVATSSSREVATKFPWSPKSDEAFVYEIVRPNQSVDVTTFLEDAKQTGKINCEDADILLKEKEIAIPYKIESNQIKGVWKVNIRTEIEDAGSPWEEKVHFRTFDDKSYTPNPNFTANKILSTAKKVGRVATAAGAAFDGLHLYESYKNSCESGNFSTFFRDTAQVLGGWTGALAFGSAGAQIGASIGTLGGPVGSAIGAVVGGVVSSFVGYSAGSNTADVLYQASDSSRVSQVNAATHSLFLNNTQYFGMNTYYTPFSSFSNTLFEAYHSSPPSWQSNNDSYGFKDSYTVRRVIEETIKEEMGSFSPSVLSAWIKAQRTLGMGVALSYSEFTQVARTTNLVNSYNSYNPCASIHDVIRFSKDIGGIASRVAVIEDLIDSSEQVCVDDYYLCFPGARLKPKLIQQVAHEIKEGYFTHKTLPFFSLHFNKEGYLYPVIHPAYQQTLVGEVIAFLDYWMKGFLNGGIFDEAFIAKWHQTANCDEMTLRTHLIDLKNYCQTHFANDSYVSLRELMTRYGLDDKESSPSSAYKQPFMTSFRIIAGQEKIERLGNVLVAHPNVQVEYSIELMPDYEQFIKNYQEQHGQYPEDYQKIRMCYEQFAKEIKEKLPQLPFCRDFFDLLGVINFYCYFYSTLEKMGKIPVLEAIAPERAYHVPKAFPPIPVRYYRRHDLKINLQEVLAKIKQFQGEAWLNETIAPLFNIKYLTQLPSDLISAISESVIALIQEKLPQAEINQEEVEKISKQTSRYMLAYVSKHGRLFNRQLNMTIDDFSLEVDKTLWLTEKFSFLPDAINTRRKEVITQWENNPANIEVNSFQVFPKTAHRILKEKYDEINQEMGSSLQFINDEIDKLPEKEAEEINSQTIEMKKTMSDQLQSQLSLVNNNIATIDNQITQISQHINNQIALIPPHLHSHNQANIFNFTTSMNAEISKLQEAKRRCLNTSTELSTAISNLNKDIDDPFSTTIQETKENIIKNIKSQTAKIQQDLLDEKKRLLSARKEAIQAITTKMWNHICDNALEQIGELNKNSLHFGSKLLETQNLSEHRLASNYVYSVISFSHHELSSETPHTRHVVGGCSMQLPNLKTETLKNGDVLAERISQQLEAENPIIVWGEQQYTVIPQEVANIPILEWVGETSEAERHLAKLIKTNELSPVPSHIFHLVMDKSGATWTHYAAQVVSGSIFQALIAQDPTILSLHDAFGHAPIHSAIMARSSDVLEAMLKAAPAQVTVCTQTGYSPLMSAIQHGFYEGVVLLLQYGANAEQVLPNGLYPLYLAIHNQYSDIACLLVNRVSNLQLNRSIDNGMTPLHLAVIGELEEIALNLIEKGARGDKKRHEDGYTALHCAVETGSLPILKALAASGHLLDAPLESGKTGLHLAAVAGNLDVVDYLVTQGCNASKQDDQGQTPLMSAIHAGTSSVADHLAKVTMINLTNRKQETASIMAVKYGLPNIADQLIQRGEDLTLCDQDDKDYLYYLVKTGDYLRLEPLLDANPSYLKQNYNGQSLLEIASHFKHTHIVSLLIDLGCRYRKKHQESYAKYLLSVDEIGLFRSALNMLEPKILEPWLTLAACSGSNRCLKFLLEKQPGQKQNILKSAVLSRNIKTLQLAIAYTSNLQATLDDNGNTILHFAVKLGDKAATKLLISSGCDVTCKNYNGQTVFDIARQQNDEYLLKRLIKWARPSDRPQSSLKTPIITQSIADFNEALNTIPDSSRGSFLELQNLLEVGNLEASLELLNEKPELLKVFKTTKGPRLFEKIFELFVPCHLGDDIERDKVLVDLLTFLKSEGIQPALYRKQHNPLLHLLKLDDDLATYRLEKMYQFFPEDMFVLLHEELSKGMTFSQLALMRGYTLLFEKLRTLNVLQESQEIDLNFLDTAILAGQMELVKILYPEGKHHLTRERKTPLMLAASMGNTRMVEKLLTFGESVDQVDLLGRTALHHAILADAEHTALALLTHSKRLSCKDRQKVSPLVLASAKGMLSVVRHLCETEGVVLDYDKYGHNALHQAAIFGHSEVIEVLIQYGYPINDPEKPSKLHYGLRRTPLHLAAFKGHIEALDKLISLGADVNAKDSQGQSVYEYAVLSCSKRMQEFVQSKLPEQEKLNYPRNLLFAAAKANQLDIIDIDIIRGCHLDQLNKNGQSLLHVCVINGSLDIARRLLSGNHIPTDIPDTNGNTPLEYAIAANNTAMIRLLMEAGHSETGKITRGPKKATIMAINRYGFHNSKPIVVSQIEQCSNGPEFNSKQVPLGQKI